MSVPVCPRCGKPLRVPVSEVWPAGRPLPPMARSLFGAYDGTLPVACDCVERDSVRRAVGHIYRAGAPVVAYWQAPSAEAARTYAGKWAAMLPKGFVAWANESIPAACLSSEETYRGLCSGAIKASTSPSISKERPREAWAVMREIGGLV